jgi:predicted dehydrogenase
MGIGQLYKTVLEKLGHKVITVDHDIRKGAMLSSVDAAILIHAPFDTVHICTPNFTHFEIAAKVAPVSKIVFIEKPGVASSATWTKLVTEFKQTRFIMVKNNMWRSNINDLKGLASQASTVDIFWSRKNCIPNPGSWFTTKKLAFGGVSRDLMPHLLSLYIAMNPDWRTEQITGKQALRLHTLESIKSTEYGTINPNGTYDVDDRCHMIFGSKWTLLADWANLHEDNSSIKFTMEDGTMERFELGWCPEDAYESMIKDAITHIDDYQFWLDQYDIDTWIHERIEKL